MTISLDELKAFRETAAAFTKRGIRPILEHESPDGDLDKVPALLDEAHQAGLLAAPQADAPGCEAGVWGSSTLADGPLGSLMILEELGAGCGGVAMCFHAAGLGSLLLCEASAERSGRAAVALNEGGFPPSLAVIDDPSKEQPAPIQTTASKDGDGWAITGRKDFVFEAPGVTTYVVFAREGSEWRVFAVPADAAGLTIEDVGRRMGLRACGIKHVKLERVKVDQSALLTFPRPVKEVVADQLRLNYLGQCAMAAGIARSALAAARQYAVERYQGCTEIINHPAVNWMLLADSESNLLVCRGLAEQAAKESGRSGLKAAAAAKLAGVEAATRAVTDSLQVFGGYGYMEDYRMEKRYRDVHTLRGAGGSARDLRILIALLSGEA